MVLLLVRVFSQVEQVRLLDRFSNKSTHGTLYLTATHLIFVESSSNNSASAAQEIWVSSFVGDCIHSQFLTLLMDVTTINAPLFITIRLTTQVQGKVQDERTPTVETVSPVALMCHNILNCWCQYVRSHI